MLKKYKEQIYIYIRNGLFFYLIFFIALNGWDKNSLQLARIGSQNKIKKRLIRKYQKNLNKHYEPLETVYLEEEPIWFCWLQGIQTAPSIVQLCYEELLNNTSKKVILITNENFLEYTRFPEYIITKYEKGIINRTHFSDLLRAELLGRNGGIWIDATALITKEIPKEITHSDLFFFQKCKPGKDGNGVYISSWFIRAKKNNKIILKTRELLFKYWEKSNYLTDYFLFHIFFCISCEIYDEEYKSVIKKESSTPHMLLLSFEEKYKQSEYEYLLSQSFIHKLSYKVSEEVLKDDSNIYNYLVKESSMK